MNADQPGPVEPGGTAAAVPRRSRGEPELRAARIARGGQALAARWLGGRAGQRFVVIAETTPGGALTAGCRLPPSAIMSRPARATRFQEDLAGVSWAVTVWMTTQRPEHPSDRWKVHEPERPDRRPRLVTPMPL